VAAAPASGAVRTRGRLCDMPPAVTVLLTSDSSGDAWLAGLMHVLGRCSLELAPSAERLEALQIVEVARAPAARFIASRWARTHTRTGMPPRSPRDRFTGKDFVCPVRGRFPAATA